MIQIKDSIQLINLKQSQKIDQVLPSSMRARQTLLYREKKINKMMMMHAVHHSHSIAVYQQNHRRKKMSRESRAAAEDNSC
jgi:arginine/lysine/ornithine decarboxylase